MRVEINKLSLVFSIMMISSSLSAQWTVDALLSKKGSSDTLKVKIINKTHHVNKESFDMMSLHKNVVIKGDDRDIWVKVKDIDYISLIDFQGNQREFISSEASPELKQINPVKKRLFEIITTGKISWYRSYYPDPISYQANARDYLIKENIDPVHLSPFSNQKKKLLMLTEDMPELESSIQAYETYDDLLNIINIYNENSNPAR